MSRFVTIFNYRKVMNKSARGQAVITTARTLERILAPWEKFAVSVARWRQPRQCRQRQSNNTRAGEYKYKQLPGGLLYASDEGPRAIRHSRVARRRNHPCQHPAHSRTDTHRHRSSARPRAPARRPRDLRLGAEHLERVRRAEARRYRRARADQVLSRPVLVVRGLSPRGLRAGLPEGHARRGHGNPHGHDIRVDRA